MFLSITFLKTDGGSLLDSTDGGTMMRCSGTDGGSLIDLII